MGNVKLDSKVSWAIALTCALMNFLIMIPVKTSAVFFIEILDRYRVGRSLAAYPAFLITFIRCSGGPFVGYFAEKFGVNEVVILGSVLSALGISACFFAEEIALAIIFLGVIHGLGVAFSNTLFPVLIKLYFKKHLAQAYGITQAGSCMGPFIASPLLLWIFQSYGTSGGFLIIGAIVLNCLPMAMILKILAPNKRYAKSDDPVKSKEQPEKKLDACVATSHETVCNHKTEVVELSHIGDVNIRIKSLNESENTHMRIIKEDLTTEHEIIPEIISNLKGNISENGREIYIHRGIKELEKDGRISIPVTDSRSDLVTHSSEKNSQIATNLHDDYRCSKSEYHSHDKVNFPDVAKHQKRAVNVSKLNFVSDSDTIQCESMSYISESSSIDDCGETSRHFISETEEALPPRLHSLNAISTRSDNHEIMQNEVTNLDKNPGKDLSEKNNKSDKNSLSIFLDLTYWNIMVISALQVFIQIIAWTTMIDLSRDQDIEKRKEVYLLMTLGISEIIGRSSMGRITDSKFLSRINFCILNFIGMGCSCSLMVLAQGFYVLMTSIFLLGITSSGLVAVVPMLIFEFFDPDLHTMGQTSRHCLFGPLSLLSGPFIGYFRGTLGSYTWLYHTIAMMSVICAAFTALIPVLAKRRDEKKKKDNR